MREVSYYPGCSLHGTAREYDESFRGVARHLGIRLQELEDWTCCGASSAHSVDEELAQALAGRNLALARQAGRELLVPCVACYSRFKEAAAAETGDSAAQEESLSISYALDYFCRDEFLKEIESKLVKALTGLKVVCYYGCLGVRPPKLTGVKQYENPRHMDRLMEVLGCEAIPWSYKTDCCGASLMMTRTDVVQKLANRLASMAREAGADIIVTGCPLCQANLDTRQDESEQETGGKYAVPVLYFTELIGLALGDRDVKKWLGRHITDPIKMLNGKGLISR
ncbi:MAG: CoB--CoM heterodisulfide reductase iron-sulfur subunit B family protein [Smithellaceae bacterium]|nr:CoB--CoM heterodisulfide reductase iron-sulfur subunit B family protein [Smithellaceae bacterium]